MDRTLSQEFEGERRFRSSDRVSELGTIGLVVVAIGALLLAAPGMAVTMSYSLSGQTQYADSLFFGSQGFLFTNADVTGTATLDFDGTGGVSLINLSLTQEPMLVEFLYLGALVGQIEVVASFSLDGGSGALVGNTLVWDTPSTFSIDDGNIFCTEFQAGGCSFAANVDSSPLELGDNPMPQAFLESFVLDDFLFDASGKFSTDSNFGEGFPISFGGLGGFAMSATLVPIPEPSTATLLGLSLVWLSWKRRLGAGRVAPRSLTSRRSQNRA